MYEWCRGDKDQVFHEIACECGIWNADVNVEWDDSVCVLWICGFEENDQSRRRTGQDLQHFPVRLQQHRPEFIILILSLL